MPPSRVALDATPLLGQPTGVGRYTAGLLSALTRLPVNERPEHLLAAAFTWRGHAELAATLPAGVRATGRRAPARLLQASWMRSDLPSMPALGVRADVFHGTNYVLPPPGRRAAGVLTIHDLSYLRVPETVTAASARYRQLVPRALRRAGMVFTPSQAVADEVIAEYGAEYGLGADRVRATPLGVDPAWFDAGASPRPAQLPERYLLFVGTLEPRKNVASLLAAYRRLRDDDPTTPTLVLAGPAGWGRALDTAGLRPQDVVSLGYLAVEALRPVVAHAAVLCYPSLYEGFGLPPLEALAAGVPVVASDIPPVREVVGAAGQSVTLVPARDVDALANAIAQTLHRRVDKRVGQAVARQFTWARTASITAMGYADVAR